MHRFYISPENWNRGALALTGSEAYHARNVLRIRGGEKVVLFNGQGREITAEIVDLTGDEIGSTKIARSGDAAAAVPDCSRDRPFQKGKTWN